jgi:hypothetical protein
VDAASFLARLRKDEQADLICREIEIINQLDVGSEPLDHYVTRVLGDLDGPTARIRAEVQRLSLRDVRKVVRDGRP